MMIMVAMVMAVRKPPVSFHAKYVYSSYPNNFTDTHRLSSSYLDLDSSVCELESRIRKCLQNKLIFLLRVHAGEKCSKQRKKTTKRKMRVHNSPKYIFSLEAL